ncbi:hypothetical protein RDWZM_009789, partial [Blomia tropicalis]
IDQSKCIIDKQILGKQSLWNNSNMYEIIDLNLYSDLDVPNEPPERNMKFFNRQN